MFQFFTDAAETFVGNRDRDLIQTINLRLRSLEDWLIEHGEQRKSPFDRWTMADGMLGAASGRLPYSWCGGTPRG